MILCIIFIASCGSNKDKKESTTDDLVVAFIDSVCSTKSDEHFSDVLWNNENEIDGNSIDDDNNGYVDDINGWNYDKNQGNVFTEDELLHCDFVLEAFSEILTANSNNNNYEIMLLNVLGTDGECSIKNLVQAIKYAEANGAHICNLSLSTYNDNDELRKVIEQSKMLFIVAAGNESENLDKGFPSYPTNYKLSNVISVAAVDENGELLEMSNYGEKTVDVAMGGVMKHNNDSVEGTSIATVKVTAVATRIYNRAGTVLSPKDGKKAILSLTEKISAVSGMLISQGIIREDQIKKWAN